MCSSFRTIYSNFIAQNVVTKNFDSDHNTKAHTPSSAANAMTGMARLGVL
jgi:hypothetical protein